jgi:hypothetical protein
VGVAETVKGMSGEFAVRSIQGAEKAIEKCRAKLDEFRSYVSEQGNDPPEFTEWAWSSNGHGRA